MVERIVERCKLSAYALARRKQLLTSSQLDLLSALYTNMDGRGLPRGGAESGETARNTCKRLVFLMQPHKSSHCSGIPSKHRSYRLKYQKVKSNSGILRFIFIQLYLKNK